ncbi:hypothetical protein LWI29_023903 [Acer saccharum]|uniref:PGG domain-containing protein n=1 Tax=Acer saccharum TaxID=4024 RepID=A0AA39VRR3_ACESA|nr:hypothetical protein LWI29_023903 [Acer saccharum]
MDPRLHVAACNGDVRALQELLQEDPLALSKAALAISSSDSPLHIAAMLGHTDFAKLVMSRNPELSRELNQQGYSPIHVASIKGHLQIVTELLNFDKGLCFLKDSEGRTPLHCAAIKGRVEVITHLMCCCPESAMEVTFKRETLLHLVISNSQTKVMMLLISSLPELNLHKLIDYVDEDGKTALQLAIARNQKQMAKMLSRETKSSGHENMTDDDDETVSIDIAGPSWKDKLESLQNAIIVICSLLATCCFDAIISPPGGVWQTRPSKEVFQAETPKNISAFPKAFVSMNITSTDLLAPNKAMSLNAIIVLCSLLATCCFDAIISPPGGVWQTRPSNDVILKENIKNVPAFFQNFMDTDITSPGLFTKNNNNTITGLLAPNKAMRMALQPVDFFLFLFWDVTCFIASLVTIYLVTVAVCLDKKGTFPLAIKVMLHLVFFSAIVLYSSIIQLTSNAAKETTFNGETLLHLVVKNNNRYEVVISLLSFLDEMDLINEIINYVNKDGNTILHLAAARKQQ